MANYISFKRALRAECMTLKSTKSDLSEQSFDRLFYSLALTQKVNLTRILLHNLVRMIRSSGVTTCGFKIFLND